MNNAQRAAFPGINARRSEIIIGGAQVYAELLERLELKGFRYSTMGLRDGMLAQMLAATDQRATSHKKFEVERWEAVLEVANRYGVDLRRADHVRAHAAQLFDALKPVHDLPPEYKFWLESAAMLQDIGKFMNHQGRHRHTQYIIANSEIFGFTPDQRAIVSAIARYLGKSRLSPLDRAHAHHPHRRACPRAERHRAAAPGGRRSTRTAPAMCCACGCRSVPSASPCC